MDLGREIVKVNGEGVSLLLDEVAQRSAQRRACLSREKEDRFQCGLSGLMLMECESHCALEACGPHGGTTERQVEQKRRGKSTVEGLLPKGFCSTWRTGSKHKICVYS